MRHSKKFNHLGRKSAHRKAMLANLTTSLILHKRIKTTLAKAKALRMYAEPIINRAKKDDTSSRRLVFSYLQSKEAVKELFGVVADKIANRPGGYTRILKTGYRIGDNAEMCFIELVDFNELTVGNAKDAKKPAKARRSRKKKSDDAPKATEAPAAPEAPAAEPEKKEEV